MWRSVEREIGGADKRHLASGGTRHIRDRRVIGRENESVEGTGRVGVFDGVSNQRLSAKQLDVLAGNRLGSASRRNDAENRTGCQIAVSRRSRAAIHSTRQPVVPRYRTSSR